MKTWGASCSLLCAACAAATARPARLGELRVDPGSIVNKEDGRLAIRSPTTRAVLRDDSPAAIELRFVYRGPTGETAPLASGELRRQIGLKIRAHDTCNVVYVMWYVGANPGLHVSLKSNPGLSRHEQCKDHGYVGIPARLEGADAPPIRVGVEHRLSARLRRAELSVFADGKLAWAGTLPREALAFDGPFGVRSDNGEFDINVIENPELPSEAR